MAEDVLKCHLQLLMKEDGGGNGLGLQGWWVWREDNSHGDGKAKCLINRCLLGHVGTLGHRKEF